MRTLGTQNSEKHLEGVERDTNVDIPVIAAVPEEGIGVPEERVGD